jgi:hypothetical protein
LGPFAAWGRYTSANNSKYSWTAAMPALSFLAIAGLAVIAFLFVAKAAPEPSSPVMVTSQHAVVPAPNTTAQAVLIDQPKSASDAVAKIPPAARATRAEAPPRNKRVVRFRGYKQTPSFGKFSIKGY